MSLVLDSFHIQEYISLKVMYRVVIVMLEIALIDVNERDLTLTGKSFVTISITTPFHI